MGVSMTTLKRLGWDLAGVAAGVGYVVLTVVNDVARRVLERWG